MAKPKALIRYEVGDGYMECDGETLWVGLDPTDSYGGSGVQFDNEDRIRTPFDQWEVT